MIKKIKIHNRRQINQYPGSDEGQLGKREWRNRQKYRQIANNFIIQMLQRRKVDTRSMYRSVRYRVNRDQQTRTADPTTCNFRIKRNSVYEATMAQTIDTGFNTKLEDSLEIKQFMRTDYLKSFNSMMEGKSRINMRQNSQRQRQSTFFQDARIILPAFEQNQKEVEHSEHSLLTPFLKPYSHVKLMLTNSQNELKAQRNTCQQIRYGLNHIKQTKQKQLKDIENLGKEHFANIRGILRKNQISQQQKKLKTKRELEQLEQQHSMNRKLFEQINDKSSNMQITIFNSTPYNVRLRDDDKGQVYI